jgi:SAM-dependent methyltransferase
MQAYTKEFYTARSDGSLNSAKEILPYVIELIKPRSVVDIGCGTGTWLSVFRDYGVDDILGIDGEYVDRTLLQIPSEYFLPYDITKPLKLNKRFDLVVSLEVGEHLPEDKAKQFVNSLGKLGDAVLFSAAIPHQPGDDHINCQWIDYWAEMFYEEGFILFDCIRLKFWQNPKVDCWYAQNMFLMISEKCINNYPLLENTTHYKGTVPPSLVHPEIYLYQQSLVQASAAENISIKRAWSLLIDSIGHRCKKLFSEK